MLTPWSEGIFGRGTVPPVAPLLTPSRRLGATLVLAASAAGVLGACSVPGSPLNGASFRINTVGPLEIVSNGAATVTEVVEIENTGISPASVDALLENDEPGPTIDNCDGQLLPGTTCELKITIPIAYVPNGDDALAGTLTVSPDGKPYATSSIDIEYAPVP